MILAKQFRYTNRIILPRQTVQLHGAVRHPSRKAWLQIRVELRRWSTNIHKSEKVVTCAIEYQITKLKTANIKIAQTNVMASTCWWCNTSGAMEGVVLFTRLCMPIFLRCGIWKRSWPFQVQNRADGDSDGVGRRPSGIVGDDRRQSLTTKSNSIGSGPKKVHFSASVVLVLCRGGVTVIVYHMQSS